MKITKWLAGLNWIDGTRLKIEPYRLDLFERAFSTDWLGRRKYTMVLSGRAKKNYKTCDMMLAGLYTLTTASAAQGNDVLVIANSEDQAGDDLDLAKKLVEANPHLVSGLEVLSKEIRRRDGRGTMRVLPSQNVVAMHGKSAALIAFDEIHGMVDWSILEALAPDPTRRDCLTWITSYDSLLDIEGAPLHDLKKIGKEGTDPKLLFSWYSADYCTDPDFARLPPEERANPSMSSWPEGNAYLETQRRRLPSSRFRRLHLNLPGAVQGAFFSQDMVDTAIVQGRGILDPMPGIHYFAGVDMSGGSSDDATLSISYWDGARAIVAGVWEQDGSCPFNPRVDGVAKFAAICRRYGVTTVHGDDYAGMVFKNDFADCGIDYISVKRSKSDFYEGLEVLFNARQVELPDELPKLRRQLLTLVRKGTTIDHPSGQHDDWATSVAIAATLVNPNMEIGGAEGWLRFMEMQIEARDDEAARLKRLQEQPASRITADMDAIRPAGPDFGFNITTAPLLKVKVPAEIAREGRLPIRWIGGEAFAEMTRQDAAGWMQNPVWAGLNPEIAKQVGVDMPHPNQVIVMVPDGAGTLIGADGTQYRTEIKNGRAVVRLPSDVARQLLNGGLPCCEPWHRENQFLAARLGAPPKPQAGINIAATAYQPMQSTTDMLTAMRGSIHDTLNMRGNR